MVYGTEEGLLVQLEEAIQPTGSWSAGSSNDSARTPINLGALDLLNHISKQVNQHVPSSMWRQMSLPHRVQHWEGRARHDEAEADYMERSLEQFVEQIRECLDPEPRRQLAGVSCPECLMSVLPRILEGETVLVPVITVWPKRLVAECLQCEAHWEGTSGLMHLGLHQKHDSG